MHIGVTKVMSKVLFCQEREHGVGLAMLFDLLFLSRSCGTLDYFI